MTVTKFATRHNPFTGEPNIKIVPIADVRERIKGTTAYDEYFKQIMDFKQAMQIPENEFQATRKALDRFLVNKSLKGTCSVRQKKNPQTKTYLLWIVNVPPKTRVNK